MMKKTNNHDAISFFKSGISRTHKVLAASVVLAAGLLYGCSDSEVNEGEAPDPDPAPVESGIETQAITVNNNPADFADRITLYGKEAGSRAGEEGEEAGGQTVYKLTRLAHVASPEAKGLSKGHNLSATCVYPSSDKAIYVCYHLNEEYGDNKGLAENNDHQGAVELVEYMENGGNNEPQMKVLSQLVNDNQDFNHCTVIGDMMYTTGDTKVGAYLGRITLTAEKKFADEKDMDLFKLHEGGSGNCVVAYGDKLLIATNKGFCEAKIDNLKKEEWSAKELAKEFVSTGASAKFIATNYLGSIVTLNLENAKENIGTAVIKSGWGTNASTLATKNYEITPTNGKNTVAVDNDVANVAYVCLGENGVVKINTESGEELGRYSLTEDRPGYEGYACANSVAVDENYVYIAYGGYGLVVLDKDMKRLTRAVWKNEEDGKLYSANYVSVPGDGKIYVAYGRNGLGVFELEVKTVK